MKRLKTVAFALTLGLIVSTGFALNWMKAKQRLGQPGINTTPTSNGVVVNIEMPEKVLDFVSTNVPQSELVTNMLPKDTSYAQKYYWSPDGFWTVANIILMGSDRSSIHKADYCLAGQGWQVLKKEEVKIPISGAEPYEISVAKWSIRKMVQQSDGSEAELRGVYSFWFVADGAQTVSNSRRILWSYRDLLTKGILQRWAYVSYLVVCGPGQEDAAFERLKSLIAASVPEFQLPPRSVAASAVARQ